MVEYVCEAERRMVLGSKKERYRRHIVKKSPIGQDKATMVGDRSKKI